MYIHHAKNIAEGIDYKDTGYIYNPFYPHLAPKTYPPVFPLLLSPVYKCFGLNLAAMKIEIILIFLASLLILFLAFRNELPFQYLVAMIAIIGFNPYFWDFKDNVLSDIPFLLFTCLSLLFVQRAYQADRSRRSGLLYAIAVGLLVCLSYGTRSLGIVLIPCVVIYDIIKCRRPAQFSIVVTLIFGLYVLLQTMFLHSDRSYFKVFAISPEVILYKVFLDTRPLSVLWDNGYSSVLRSTLFLIVCVLAIIGYVKRIKGGVTVFEIFLPLYLIPVIVVPIAYGTRYLIPVIPLYVFYALVGVKKLSFFEREKLERPVFIILIAAIFVSYGGKYLKTDYGPIAEGVGKRESIELFDYIKENTAKEDIFIFRKPRVLALFAGRRTSAYHLPQDDKELWGYFREINAAYIIIGRPFLEDWKYLRFFVEKYKNSLQEVYSNADFIVYKINYALP